MDDYNGNGNPSGGYGERVSWENPYATLAGLSEDLEEVNRVAALNQGCTYREANGFTVWVVHNLD